MNNNINLKKYKLIGSNIHELKLNDKIKYITIEPDGTKIFNKGGNIRSITSNYIVIQRDNNFSWTIDLNKVLIYLKINQ